MSGAGRRVPIEPDRHTHAVPIPIRGTGRPSIDTLYRQAAGDRDLFRRLVAVTWPPPARPRT